MGLIVGPNSSFLSSIPPASPWPQVGGADFPALRVGLSHVTCSSQSHVSRCDVSKHLKCECEVQLATPCPVSARRVKTCPRWQTWRRVCLQIPLHERILCAAPSSMVPDSLQLFIPSSFVSGFRPCSLGNPCPMTEQCRGNMSLTISVTCQTPPT